MSKQTPPKAPSASVGTGEIEEVDMEIEEEEVGKTDLDPKLKFSHVHTRGTSVNGNALNVKTDDPLKKEGPTQRTIGAQPLEDSNLSSVRSSQHRVRSLSPSEEIQKQYKKPTILCEFFARGWCIKGNNCKFLHQGEGSRSESQLAKMPDLTGSVDGQPKVFSMQEVSYQSDLHRALIRTYGGESEKGDTAIDSPLPQSSNAVNPLIMPENQWDPHHRHWDAHYSGHDSYNSYSGTSMTRSSPFQTASQLGASSITRCTPTFENADLHRSFDFDKGYNASRSRSSLGSSEPHYLRSDAGSMSHTDFTASFGLGGTIKEDPWENSLPFRPSFDFSLQSISSAGCQYDPLVDSIDPPKVASVDSQKSAMAISQSIDDLILGSTTVNAYKSLTARLEANIGRIDKNQSAKGSSELPTLTACSSGHYSRSNENATTRVEVDEKTDQAEVRSNQDNQFQNKRESKAMQSFHFSLAEFVKELVKPYWKEGQLSKDAYRMVVKKTVEKVLGALQPHQVPTAKELINDYLTVSKSKILKLVEAYVQKYGKL